MPRPPPVTIATRSRRSTPGPLAPAPVNETGSGSIAQDAAAGRARAGRQLCGDPLGMPLAQPLDGDALAAILRAPRPERAEDERLEPARVGPAARRSGIDVVAEFLASHDQRFDPRTRHPGSPGAHIPVFAYQSHTPLSARSLSTPPR